MGQCLEVLAGGITQGAIYCVFAFGLSLVYGTTRIMNFAHGSFYMVGGYLDCVLSVVYFGFSYPIVFLIAVPLLFLVGVAVERVVIRPLRWAPSWKTSTMMATLGLAFVIDNLNLIVFGPGEKLIPPLAAGTLSIGGLVISYHKVMVCVLAIGILAALELFFSYAFGLSVVLAGTAGILLAPIYLISPLGGWPPFLKAFVIVVFGGLGSTRGVFYSAFLLAIIESFVIFEIGATWTMPVWLLTLLVVLIVRPQGLLGVRTD